MGEKLRISIVLVLAMSAFARAESASELLENGLYTEQTVGDLEASIRIYKKVLEHPNAQQAQKAQAQFRIGMCHMKKRRQAEARKAFTAVLENYADQKELTAEAKLRLRRLTSPNPAALMPPGTLVYAEIGRPGDQVEKIVQMLKGTPLANPLAAMGGGRRATTRPGQPGGDQKTPADIVSALLNPSMLAEFKKVRGMAVGVAGIDLGGRKPPPFVVALYPGESEALRGILTAALLMAGRPSEDVEEMKTLVIEQAGDIACAYDENVILVADSKQQLTWCIKQYKGGINQASLATHNKSFAALTQQQSRQADALTVWADPARVFAEIQKQLQGGRGGRMPQELRIADSFLDFKNIEGAVARLIIDEKDPYVEVTAALKDGHECLAYDLIRTPPLSRAGLEAVPAEAVGLLSIALGRAGEGGERAAREAFRRVTGLDIGRELFANIEQVNLFALPPTGAAAESARAEQLLFSCLGLALTSREPRRTRLLLDRLLSIPEMIMGLQPGAEAPAGDKPAGRYFITRLGRQNIYCHVGQAGRSTVLALDPRVVGASLAAARAGKGALGAGPLRQDLSQLPAGTSKLILINAGGAVRLAGAYAKLQVSSAPEMQPDVQRMMAAFSELADALARTNLHFNTIEGPNRLTARLGVSDLAPLNDLFPLVMKSMQAFSSARPRPRPRPARTTPVRQSRPPITTSPSGAVRPSPAQRAAAQAAASRASRQWLQLADDGRYADCWNDLAAAGRRISTQQKFGAELKASRAPLGKVISRKLLAYSWGHSGGKIDSFQFTYRTSFQGAPKATESVSARRQRDGRWLVSNYRVDAGKVQDQSSRASNAGAPPGPRG